MMRATWSKMCMRTWVNRLRRVVFPSDRRWRKEDRDLYVRMKDVLRAARKDPKVMEE